MPAGAMMAALPRNRSHSEFTFVSKVEPLAEEAVARAALPPLSCDVLLSALTLSWLRRPDMRRKVTQKVFVEQQQSFALIWGLLLSVASSGMFTVNSLPMSAHGEKGMVLRLLEHLCGFFFCSAIIAFVIAVFGCLLLIMAAAIRSFACCISSWARR